MFGHGSEWHDQSQYFDDSIAELDWEDEEEDDDL